MTLPLPGWFSGLIRIWNKFWTETLGQPAVEAFHIPFVDFARGNGLHIGPGEAQGWTAVLVDESTPWLSQYRGLWGLFARDPISGENAPAGPMYNRDGSPRASWYDPLGFAGLDKVPPPPKALQMLTDNCQKVSHRLHELEKLIPEKAARLQSLGVKLKAMEDNPHLAKQHAALEKEIGVLANEVHALRRESSENAALFQGLTHRLEAMRSGLQDAPRAHINHLVGPENTTQTLRFDRAAETWAAVSLSLLLFIIAGLIFLSPRYLWAGLAVVLVLFIVLESILRGAFVRTIARITLILAMLASLILFLHFWKWAILAALLAMGLSLMVQRLRELTG